LTTVCFLTKLKFPQDLIFSKTEYLVGRKILVAPVMDEGAVSRDIYLPSGVWQDMNTGQLHNGQSWLRDYPAPLDTLPYFELVSMISGANSVTLNCAFFSLLATLAVLLLK
jgi:Glycosyl hydrolases family 31